ncbi:MAG: hypothetical protein FWF80_06085 [Defluviitaleaceae bacterium]|nr:hypothetical protein [Defluviitaleaceae bacterium]
MQVKKKARKITPPQYKAKTDTFDSCRAERLVRHDFPQGTSDNHNAVTQTWQFAGR